MHKFNRKISNSALSKIDPDLGGSPKKFLQYMDRIADKETEEMKLGKLIHKAILEPEKFNPDIIVMPEPGVTAIMDEYTKDTTVNILEIAKNKNYRQNWKDETIKKYLAENGMEYLQSMLINKDIMSLETYNLIQSAINAFNSNSKIQEIIYSNHNDNELQIDWNYRDFECKGIIDKLITSKFNFSTATKDFSIIDLKVTTKPVQDYYKTFRQFKTYRQIAFYVLGMSNSVYENTGEHYVFVISLHDNNPVAMPFLVSKDYLNRGLYEIDRLLDRLEFHIEKNNWLYPMEIIQGELLTLQCPNFLKQEELINWYE